MPNGISQIYQLGESIYHLRIAKNFLSFLSFEMNFL